MTRALVFAILLVGALAMAVAGDAVAESSRHELKNVKSYRFHVVNLNEASQRCGLSEAAMQEAFTEQMGQSGLEIVATSGYWIYLRATTAVQGDRLCITYVDATVVQNTRYYNSATLSERSGQVEHWRDGSLMASDMDEHDSRIRNVLRQMGGRLVDFWQRTQ